MSRRRSDATEATNAPRQHHLVPAFYLAGFTSTLSRDGPIWVFRYKDAAHYRTTPKKACRERDYYRYRFVADDSGNEFYMEHVLDAHEGEVSPFVRRIANDRRASDKNQVGQAIALAAGLLVRGREARKSLEARIPTNIIKALRSGRVTRDEWDRCAAEELANGAAAEDWPDYDAARDLALRGDWRPKAPRAILVGAIPDRQVVVTKTLRRHKWQLIITDSKVNGGFVTSDGPVTWGDLEQKSRGKSYRLDEPGVEITFPVSKDAALVAYSGAFEGNSIATDDIVAHVNARTVHMSGEGEIMHAHQDFLIRTLDGDIRKGYEYFHYVREAKRRGIWAAIKQPTQTLSAGDGLD